MPLHLFLHTEPGGHPLNEDYVLARVHPAEADLVICLLADGMGGRANGAAAARATCEAAWRAASALRPQALRDPAAWRSVLAAGDRAAVEAQGFTTLLGLAADRAQVCGGSCGDSKAFSLAGSEWVEWTAHQRKHPPVGSGAAVFETFAGPRHGRVLLVSDGVWKYSGQEALRRSFTLGAGSEVIDSLRRAALLPAGGLPDVFSLIALE